MMTEADAKVLAAWAKAVRDRACQDLANVLYAENCEEIQHRVIVDGKTITVTVRVE